MSKLYAEIARPSTCGTPNGQSTETREFASMAQVLLSTPAMVLPQLETSQLGTFQRSGRRARSVVWACVLAASPLACDEPVTKDTGDASAQVEEDSRLRECSEWCEK